jgi:hypothetical protein
MSDLRHCFSNDFAPHFEAPDAVANDTVPALRWVSCVKWRMLRRCGAGPRLRSQRLDIARLETQKFSPRGPPDFLI